MTKLNKVLTVDDSTMLHFMYRLILNQHFGCTIVEAKNGQEALDILSRDDNFDLILLDINMPVMNGVRFMEILSTENIHRQIPIIVISTESAQDDTIRALKLGAWGYIVKPFERSTLCDLIEQVVTKRPPFLAAVKSA